MHTGDRVTVILEPFSRRVEIPAGKTVYEALLALGIPIGALCGGKGLCGKCKIVVDKDSDVSPVTENERKKLGGLIEKGYRLACMTRVKSSSVRVYLPEDLIPRSHKIATESAVDAILPPEVRRKMFSHLPTVIRRYIQPEIPTYENPLNDLTRAEESLRFAAESDGNGVTYSFFGPPPHACTEADNGIIFTPYGRKSTEITPAGTTGYIDPPLYTIIRRLPYIMRSSKDGYITVLLKYVGMYTLWGVNTRYWRVFAVYPGKKTSPIYGLAIDIGTTTIVGYLINLENGVTAAVHSMLNPQVSIGEDIISRLTFIKDRPNGAESARGMLIDGLNSLIDNICKKASVNREDIVDVAVVGNTAIHHMFYGLPTGYLGVSPYPPVCKSPVRISASTAGLRVLPSAEVYSPPVFAGYVGTDTVGCIISSRPDLFDKMTLLIDIGTNGELVFGNSERLITGSCAAGSALEGAQIAFGMRAAPGAIESVRIDPESWAPEVTVIGRKTPAGICGSGLIDAIAEMLRAKIITRAGKFNKKNPLYESSGRIIETRDGPAYILFDSSKDVIPDNPSNNGKKIKIYISQKDIREFQKAKGAFLAGAYLLMEKFGERNYLPERVLLAGGFGTYIDPVNAAFVGLFPDMPTDRIFQIGNAAGLGAVLCITNRYMRELANNIPFGVDYYEIAGSPKFGREYAYAMYFPHYDLKRFPRLAGEYAEIPPR